MQIRRTVPDVATAAELSDHDESLIPALCSSFYLPLATATPAHSEVQVSTELFIGARQILFLKDELNELRSRCDQQHDLTTDIEYFLSCKHARNCRPLVLCFRAGTRLAAAIFLHELCFLWLGTRLCAAGDSAGDGLLIAPAQEREIFLSRAINELINVQKRFHSVRLCVKTASAAGLVVHEDPGIRSKLVERTVKHRLALADTYNGMLASFGLRTRRSLRTKRRQLEDALRPDFFPGLAPDEAFAVMSYLRRRTSPDRSKWYFESRRKFLRSHTDAFAMALRAQDGTWLSALSGWRRDGTTYVDMQLNHSAFRRESLSAVMRAFLLEHEIGIGQRQIEFVGGCSALLERYCAPTEPVADLLVTRSSIRGWCLKKGVELFCDQSFKKWLYF